MDGFIKTAGMILIRISTAVGFYAPVVLQPGIDFGLCKPSPFPGSELTQGGYHQGHALGSGATSEMKCRYGQLGY